MKLSAPQIVGILAILFVTASCVLLRKNPLDKNGRSPLTKWKIARIVTYIVSAVLAVVAVVWNLIVFYL